MKKELFKLIAGNCHSHEATKDAVNKIMDYLESQQNWPSEQEVKLQSFIVFPKTEERLSDILNEIGRKNWVAGVNWLKEKLKNK